MKLAWTSVLRNPVPTAVNASSWTMTMNADAGPASLAKIAASTSTNAPQHLAETAARAEIVSTVTTALALMDGAENLVPYPSATSLRNQLVDI